MNYLIAIIHILKKNEIYLVLLKQLIFIEQVEERYEKEGTCLLCFRHASGGIRLQKGAHALFEVSISTALNYLARAISILNPHLLILAPMSYTCYCSSKSLFSDG